VLEEGDEAPTHRCWDAGEGFFYNQVFSSTKHP